ncbi:tRNA-His guanylyltransferase [Hanseniaspora vineae]
MANSKFEYVRVFETHTTILPETYIVVRIDGKNFHEFSAHYNFDKPNDIRALGLMNAAAKNLVLKYKSEIICAFGESDEYSFILRKDTALYNRRSDKIATLFVSYFTAQYIFLWNKFFQTKENPQELDFKHLPCFDSRCVTYPNLKTIKDYLSWRFVDTHINNLYNTAFWKLILVCGLDPKTAEAELCGTLSSDKNEILWKRCNVNYNDEPEIFKKGSLINKKGEILHIDVIKNIDTIFKGFE